MCPCVCMCGKAPEICTPEHMWTSLETTRQVLLGPLGMRTLDPRFSYCIMCFIWRLTFCLVCNCNWGTCIAPPTRRPRAHHKVNPYPGVCRQNETEMFSDHDETSPSIAAVSEKAQSPIRRRVRGTTRLPHDEVRSVDRPGILATDVRSSEIYSGVSVSQLHIEAADCIFMRTNWLNFGTHPPLIREYFWILQSCKVERSFFHSSSYTSWKPLGFSWKFCHWCIFRQLTLLLHFGSCLGPEFRSGLWIRTPESRPWVLLSVCLSVCLSVSNFNTAVGWGTFRQHLKMFVFISYLRIQCIRRFMFVRCINLH